MRQVYLFISLMLAQTGWAESINTVKDAKRYGADAKIVLRCIDQDGLAVANARIQTGLSPDGSPERSVRFDGYSDTNGCFSISGKSGGETTWIVNKDGFYQTYETRYLFKDPTVSVSSGRWQPYGMTNTVVLKRIINPVPMFRQYKDHILPPPPTNQWVGFDFEANDWCMPNGRGKQTDFEAMLFFENPPQRFWNEFKYTLTLRFTNALDGVIQTRLDDSGSLLRTAYTADTNAVYAKEIIFSAEQSEGGERNRSYMSQKILDETEYLVFRVRSKVDDEGNLLKANYGKIRGPLFVARYGFVFSYDFNPKANDPSLESDTSVNLLPPHNRSYVP